MKDSGCKGTLIFLAVVTLIVSFFACYDTKPKKTKSDLKIVSVKMLSYNQNEHGGKFIEICLNRKLKQRERYTFVISIKPKTADQIEAGFIVDNRFDDVPQCFKQNVFLFTSRHNEHRNKIIKNHIKKGNVQFCHVKIFDKSDIKTRNVISEARFVDL